MDWLKKVQNCWLLAQYCTFFFKQFTWRFQIKDISIQEHANIHLFKNSKSKSKRTIRIVRITTSKPAVQKVSIKLHQAQFLVLCLKVPASVHAAASAETAGVWCAHPERVCQNAPQGNINFAFPVQVLNPFWGTMNGKIVNFYEIKLPCVSSDAWCQLIAKTVVSVPHCMSVLFDHCGITEVMCIDYNTADHHGYSCWPITMSVAGSTTACQTDGPTLGWPQRRSCTWPESSSGASSSHLPTR